MHMCPLVLAGSFFFHLNTFKRASPTNIQVGALISTLRLGNWSTPNPVYSFLWLINNSPRANFEMCGQKARKRSHIQMFKLTYQPTRTEALEVRPDVNAHV